MHARARVAIGRDKPYEHLSRTVKYDEALGGYSQLETIGDLTYGVSGSNLWLTDPNGAWVEKRSNPTPTTEIGGTTYGVKGDKVLYDNGTIGE